MRDLRRFLVEDLGRRGDVTTRRVVGRAPLVRQAVLYAREPVVAAGLAEAAEVFRHFRVRVVRSRREGAWVPRGAPLLVVRGPVQGILTGERLALNFLGRMSGIATATRRMVDRVRAVNPRCRVAATRKTTPGFRAWEKRAVTLGGGEPHRFGLFDAILVKDNHLAVVGSVAEAVRRARVGTPRMPVEVEVSRLRDAEAAARARADWILVDNLSPARARRLAERARVLHPRIRVEVSGGLDESNVAAYARFADRVSVGRLTHSARGADVTLDLCPPKR